MHSYQLPNSANAIVRGGKSIVVNNPPNIKKPFEQWPAWAKGIALLKTDADKGVGDTVYRTIGPDTSAAFKTWFILLFGRSCGCAKRHVKWNAEFPYA